MVTNCGWTGGVLTTGAGVGSGVTIAFTEGEGAVVGADGTEGACGDECAGMAPSSGTILITG